MWWLTLRRSLGVWRRPCRGRAPRCPSSPPLRRWRPDHQGPAPTITQEKKISSAPASPKSRVFRQRPLWMLLCMGHIQTAEVDLPEAFWYTAFEVPISMDLNGSEGVPGCPWGHGRGRASGRPPCRRPRAHPRRRGGSACSGRAGTRPAIEKKTKKTHRKRIKKS